MSAKQAKRLRQKQRAAGVEPRLDVKRRLSQEEHDRREAAVEGRLKFKREHPEEYADQEAERIRKGRIALAHFGALMGMLR
jgi:hypothetical protein